MNDKNITDLKINGQGTAPGGTYKLVRINGGGKVGGDIVCDECIVNGSGEFAGGVQSKSMRINGSAQIGGDVQAEKLLVQGNTKISADVNADELTVRGYANIEGAVFGERVSILGSADINDKLNAKEIKIAGALKAGGDLSAEKFTSTGQFQVDGLLSADTIDVQIGWSKSTAKEVGGENISVRMSLKGLSTVRSILSINTKMPLFVTSTIEGNDIQLERTKADVVRGHNVTLGAGCDIGLVEYSGSLKTMGAVSIGQEKKV